MDEITLFTVVRPAAPDLSDDDRMAVRLRLLEAASFEAAAPGQPGNGNVTRLRFGRRGMIGAVAVGAAAAAVLGVALPGITGTPRTTGPAAAGSVGRRGAPVHLGRAGSAAELVAYATQAAAAAGPFAPQPHQWIYTKALSANSSAGGGGFLFGPPNERQTTVSWARADHLQQAGMQHGKLQISGVLGVNKRYTKAQTRRFQQVAELGSVAGWPDSSYRYLESLPTDPAQLEAIIAANVRAQNNVTGYGATGIFTAIYGLLENTVLPPKLYAGLYGVLSRLPGVHFDAATDLAGRRGLGLYMVVDGFDKSEIVINPETYAYMGFEDVSIKAYKDTGTDGTRLIRKGQILGWEALLASGIVSRPGQVP